MNPSAQFVLRLFGGFSLERDALPCKLAYEKGRALLAYLAVEPGRAHSREFLATMFWPDIIREAALTNLRQVLHDLRQAFNAASLVILPLQVDREAIRLDPLSDLVIDAAEFFVPAPACPAIPCPAYCDLCLAKMGTLAGCYRGEFMAGFSLPECQDFEEWLHIQREALHLRAIALLARLSDCHERMGTYVKSLPFALRFLELEPWNEEGLRRVMRLFALNGQRDAALTQYEISSRALKRELGALPSEEALALAERIRHGELPPVVDRILAPVAMALPLSVTERRQITVLYCELTPAAIDDPDEAMALLRTPQTRCMEIIRQFSGHIVQAHGGGLLAYFGYPQASEHAARLAVQAALAVTRAKFPGIALRAGIHTGMVISGGDQEVPDAVGATSGLAIHLRQLADYGGLVISSATQHLIAGYFECVSLGFQQFPGIACPLEVVKVGRESGAMSRLEAAATLTPLVGRQDEIATLLAAWQDARRRVRRVVLLRGEAGIGKSRLVHAFREALRGQACIVRELRCFPERSQSPFYPLTAMLEAFWGFAPGDSPEQKSAKLASDIEAYYPASAQQVVPLLTQLFSLPHGGDYQAPDLSPQQCKEQTLAILLDMLWALVARQPVLLIVEDLHWIDPSSLELLTRFIGQKKKGTILTLLTARPEFAPPWNEASESTLEIAPLAEGEVAEIVASISAEIPAATLRRIVERADGITLFAEEMAKIAILDNQASIPATLHDLLAARLDSMGEAKRTAQLAATIGREFDLDLLRKVSTCDPTALARTLNALQNAGLILKVSKTADQFNPNNLLDRYSGDGLFAFKHALIQEAAYQSQTRADRQASHRLIAAALKTTSTETRPELLAQHWAVGGETREAVVCWIEAGKLASQRSANQEAVAHCKSGLALIEALPDDPERVRLELDLQICLGAAACAAQGYASADGANAYARAMALCGQHESGSEMFQSIWGLWASASSRAGYAHALELAQQLLRMANQSGDSVPAQPGDQIHAQQGHFAVADTLYWQGEFAAARGHLECVRTLYQPAHHESHVAQFGEDAGVTSGAYLSWVLWFLGFPDQARKASAQSLALARQLGHPYSLAYALTFAAILHCRLRQPEEALSVAEETLGLANDHGFPLWQIGATIARGWALAMQSHREGVETMRQCAEAMRAAMGGVTLVVLGPLVDAYIVLGHYDAALSVSDEVFAAGKAIGDHHVEAELYRFKGETLLGLDEDNAAQAETCFQQALAVSRKQEAKSLELRAAMSMAQLWQKQGKSDDARRLLEEVYRWFTEGFDTHDLQDARKLLDSLGG